MRIAHVLPALAKGGAERVVVDLSRHAVASGHDVTILLGWPSGDEAGIADGLPPEVRVEHITPSRPIGRLALLARYARLAAWVPANRAALERFDILHVHLTFGSALGTMLHVLRDVARAGARPIIVETYHSVGIPIARYLRPLHRALAQRRDAVVLMAEDETWHMGADAAVSARTLILNGTTPPPVQEVTDAERAEYRARFGIPDGATVLGQVGRLHPERRPEKYVEIFAHVLRELPDAYLLIAGGGYGTERIEALIAERGLSARVRITGPVERIALPLSIMDLYLTINMRAITGVAAMEAALAGLPIVAYQLLPEHRTSDADWIWSSTDVAQIAQRAVALLRDPAGLQALAATQHAYAATHHTTERMGTAYEALYAELLQERVDATAANGR